MNSIGTVITIFSIRMMSHSGRVHFWSTDALFNAWQHQGMKHVSECYLCTCRWCAFSRKLQTSVWVSAEHPCGHLLYVHWHVATCGIPTCKVSSYLCRVPCKYQSNGICYVVHLQFLLLLNLLLDWKDYTITHSLTECNLCVPCRKPHCILHKSQLGTAHI